MTIRWKNKEEHNESMRRFRQSHAGGFRVRDRGNNTFEEHSERISTFSKSHVADLAVKVSKRDLLDSMTPLQVSRTMIETGGSRSLTGTAEWSALIPMRKVASSRFSQN